MRKRKPTDHGFSNTLPLSDKRQKRWAKQRKERGFDDTELWSLNYSISLFLAPRLREFAKRTISYPGSVTPEEWSAIVNEIAEGFEEMQKETSVDYRKVHKALGLFRKWFYDLWS